MSRIREPTEILSERTRQDGDCLIWIGASTGTNNMYGSVRHNGRKHRAHRWAWELVNGPIPNGVEIDHECHNKKCVNVEHLRPTTHKQNMENRSGGQRGSFSGIRGVSFNTRSQKYIAVVTHNGVQHYLGRYTDKYEAGEVARLKRLELYTHNNLDKET